MDATIAALLISLAACLANVLGVALSRDRRTEEDAIWRGEVNGKLDAVCGIKTDVQHLKEECRQNAKNVAVADASVKSAHHRIDELARQLQADAGRLQRG